MNAMKNSQPIFRTLLTAAIQDATVPAIATYLFNDKWSWGTFALIFACIYAFRLVLWVNSSAWGWLRWFAFGRNEYTALALQALKTYKFPEAEERQFIDLDDYFGNIVTNKDYSPEVRIRASSDLAALNVLRVQGSVQSLYRISKSYCDALRAYSLWKMVEPDNSL